MTPGPIGNGRTEVNYLKLHDDGFKWEKDNTAQE